jgi:hypothetical protein
LVELMVVISVNTVLMAVAASLLATLLRAQESGRHHYERTGALVRLADQWRSDVAASRTGVVVPGAEGVAPPAVLRLQDAEDNKIEFFRDGDRLRRIEYRGPTVVRREAYTLSDLAKVEFSVAEGHIATLRLSFARDKGLAGDVWQIDARLARDGRFVDREPGAEQP